MTDETTDKPTSAKKTVNFMDVARMQAVMSKLEVMTLTKDGYDNFCSRVGLLASNQLSQAQYDFNLITRNRVELEAAYRGAWIVGRVIDSVADDMTRAGVTITTKAKDDLQVLKKRMTRLQLWQSLNALIKWGELYGGALGVMQIEGQDTSTPLDPETVAQGQFKGISVYDRWMLNPLMQPVIETGPEIGLPVFYQIVNDPTTYGASKEWKPDGKPLSGAPLIHYTRAIRYTGIDLPYFQAITEMMWGESVLERLWDRLISFDNASMSSAQLIDRANLRTVSVDGLREILAAGGQAQEALERMFEMMRRAQDNEGLTLIDKNDTFASTAYSFAGLSDMMLQFAQQMSGACEVPLVVLFGQSPAGLGTTAEADLRIYYSRIAAKQEAKLRNPVSDLIQVLWRSTFGVGAPEDLDFTFVPLWQMDATDKANIAKTNAETVIGSYEAGLQSLPAAMKDLRSLQGETGLFSNITDEEIDAAEMEPAPLPDEAEKVTSPVPSLGASVTDKKPKRWFAWLSR